MLNVVINSFHYSDKEILNNIEFKLEKGQHLSVLGESGCGKSTLLHLIYGLLHLEEGQITWMNKQLLGPRHNLIPGETFIKLVAQEFNVMPFITVSENIATHLNRMDSKKDDHRVSELLEVVDLSEFRDTLVKNLSGGQKQRVALAKALAKEPELLLLDEPFSNIDSFRKNKLRRDLFEYLKTKNISCITATHDSVEALSYADEIILIKNGRIELKGTPEAVFGSVHNDYQAGFFGDVSILPSNLFSSEKPIKDLILLPYQLIVSNEESNLEVTVKKSYFRGHYYLISAVWNDREVFFNTSEKLEIGTIVNLIKK